MKNILKYTLVLALALFIIACAQPDEPSNAQVLPGEWRITSYILNGELEDVGFTHISLILERDNKFIFIEPNGRSYAGTWLASDTELTLNASSGETLAFTLVTLRADFMHLMRTVNSPAAGELEFRYVLNRVQSL